MGARSWDIDTGKQLVVLEGHSGWVRAVATSPDEAQIDSGSNDDTARVWKVHTGKESSYSGDAAALCCPFHSPDGAHIASNSEDEFVRVWDVKTGWQLALIKGHMGSVEFAAFSID
jgi:WD40 repeat protein